MSRNTLLAAACLLLVGLLVGYIAGSGGPSLADIDRTVTARVDAAGKAQADRVAALETQVADLGKQVDAVSAKVESGSTALQGLTDRIGTDLGDLGTKLGDSVSAMGASNLAALQSGLDRLKSTLSAAPAAAPASGGAAAPTAAATGAPAGNGAGETLVLSNGAARIFVSRIDDAAGEATVYVNGAATTLKVGETKAFSANDQDCQVTLAALDRGHATLSGGCGSDLPQATGTPAGTVVTLADGALRVFVSAVDADAARIAVNGVQTEEVAVGKSLDVTAGDKSCTVTVTGVDRGHVALDGSCS